MELIFFSENSPLRSKGAGISVLLFNIIQALKGTHPISLITFSAHTGVAPEEIDADNQGVRTLICDRFFYKFMCRVNHIGLVRDVVKAGLFVLSLPRIAARANRRGNLVITVIGASARPLWKYAVMKLLFRRAKHGLYIVDDLELINARSSSILEKTLLKLFLRNSLVNTDVLITISDGLRDTYLEKFGKESTILLPHFEQREILRPNPSRAPFIFLFTGGLNFLYNHSLRLIAGAIAEINASGTLHQELKLVIQTYSPRSEFDRLGFGPAAEYSTAVERTSLAAIYENCHCFLVPYSFDPADRQIVRTSFPQKVAEIIQYGRPILAFGPAYSSVIRFFNENRMDYACISSEELRERIITIAGNGNFNPQHYLDVYAKSLSAACVRSVFKGISDKYLKK